MKVKLAKEPRFILIDDDQMYNTIMSRVAQQEGLNLDVFTSLMELGSVALLGQYDVAIVDFHLEHMTGLEVAAYMTALFGDMPTILVSQSKSPEYAKDWPKSVVSFIAKSAGYHYVLQQAQKAAIRRRQQRWQHPAAGQPLPRQLGF